MTVLHRAAAVLLLLAVAWVHGQRTGAARVRADWQADTLARERASAAAEAAQRRQAHAAGERYEAQRAALQAQATQARAALRDALQRPICPAAAGDSHAPTLADLPIPAAAVERLRHAGADVIAP